MIFPWVEYGLHWLNSRPHACPRINGGPTCPLCELGFDLHKVSADPADKKDIIQTYMPSVKYLVNVYFPDNDQTPEDLRGSVRWISMPKTIKDIMEKTLLRDDDGGDADKPLPYGAFYLTGAEEVSDNTGGYTFCMEIRHKGGYNDYEKSEFLARTMRPLAGKSDGTPDMEKISEILAQRHDLYQKMDSVDMEQLQQITNTKLGALSGEPASSGFDVDESSTVAETPVAAAAVVEPVVETSAPVAEPVIETVAVTGGETADDEKLAELLAKLHNQD